jgi:hypothetical protein
VLKEIEAEAAREDCRALISQINAELFAEEPFVNVSRGSRASVNCSCADMAGSRSATHHPVQGFRCDWASWCNAGKFSDKLSLAQKHE